MTKRIFGLLSILAVALTVPLSAQTVTLKANIPFAFTIGNKSLPAGEYVIRNDSNPSVLIFQGEERPVGALIMVTRGAVSTDNAAADAKLVFNRYGDQYFLSEVVDGYMSSDFVVPMPKAERELSKTASAEHFEIFATLARR